MDEAASEADCNTNAFGQRKAGPRPLTLLYAKKFADIMTGAKHAFSRTEGS